MSLQTRRWLRVFAAVLAVTFSMFFSASVCAQQQNESAGSGADLASELESLRSKVAELEQTLREQHQSRYSSVPKLQQGSMTRTPMSGSDSTEPSSSKKPGMQTMKGMKGMAGMKSMQQASGSQGAPSGGMNSGMMSQGGMKTGGMMSGKLGMGMMGRNPAMKNSLMPSMNMPSALPGFPGASHLYHIGETGFFLDHPQHITLTDQQLQRLNQLKEQALLAVSSIERKIGEAEQQLWTLTAEAQPDINKIESKAKEIAQLTVTKRIDFIRSVGKAAGVLTDEQQMMLVGIGSSEAKEPAQQH